MLYRTKVENNLAHTSDDLVFAQKDTCTPHYVFRNEKDQ